MLHALELVIAGSKSNSAGEALLEVPFSQLPAEWQVRNYHVQGGVVEFSLRAQQLVLPIDSKLPATAGRLSRCQSRGRPGKGESNVRCETRRGAMPRPRPDLGYGGRAGWRLRAVRSGGDARAARRAGDQLKCFFYILLVYKVALAASSDIDRLRLDGYMRRRSSWVAWKAS